MPTSVIELDLPVVEAPPAAAVSLPAPPVRSLESLRHAWQELPDHVRAQYADRAEGRLDFIKGYQLESAALTALKGSAINGSVMGSGKTLMAIFHAFAINANRTAVILPTRLINTWKRECARVKIPCVRIENASDARRVRKELWAQRRRGEKPSSITLYLISWEWLSLGGESNRTFDPWYATLDLASLGNDTVAMITAIARKLGLARNIEALFRDLTGDSAAAILREYDAEYRRELAEYDALPANEKRDKAKPVNLTVAIRGILDCCVMVRDAERGAAAANLPAPLPLVDFQPIWDTSARRRENSTLPAIRVLCESGSAEKIAAEFRRLGVPIAKGQPYRYEAHNPVCPRCAAKTPTWRGTHCQHPDCRYEPRSYLGSLIGPDGQPRELVMRNRGSKERRTHRISRSSNRVFPGYKLLPKFDLKIVEEFHKAVSLNTLHGLAIFDVEATDTLLLSGTICRSYITELEPALALVHDENSPEFPYARHNLSDFRARFSSFAAKWDIRPRGRNRLVSRTVIPEASNLNALRRILAQRLVAVDESVVDAEWNLRSTPERMVGFELLPEEHVRYQQVLDSVLNWRAQLMEMIESGDRLARSQAQNALLRGARNRVDLISAITNGPSKVAAAVRWVQEEVIRDGHRSIVSCRSVALFKALESAFRKAGFEFAVCDESIGNEDRDEFLSQFAESKTPLLLTRIKLVCEGFNQLVCCTRQLMCEVERSPSDNRQFQKRMNRPGQLRPQDIRCDMLVARLPSRRASIDEIEIRRFLRKERAIKEVTGRQARFRGAAALLEATQQSRGLLLVLDDLAARVLTEFAPESAEHAPTTLAAEAQGAMPAASAQMAVAAPLDLPVAELAPTPAPQAESAVHAPVASGEVSTDSLDAILAGLPVVMAATPRPRRSAPPRRMPARYVQELLSLD